MSVGVVNKQTGDRIPTAGMPAIDSVLSGSSTNPVQNKVVKAALDEKADTDIVASDFDATASYTAGNYCIYEGKFYRFKNNHSGAWAAADVDEIQIAGELSSIKSGLTNMDLLVENSGTLNITGVMSKYKQFLILVEGTVEGSQNKIGVSCIIATNSIKSSMWRNRYPMYGDVVLYAEIPGSVVSANGFIVNIASSDPQSAWVYSVKAIYGFN